MKFRMLFPAVLIDFPNSKVRLTGEWSIDHKFLNLDTLVCERRGWVYEGGRGRSDFHEAKKSSNFPPGTSKNIFSNQQSDYHILHIHIQPVDLKTRKSTGTSCQIETHSSIQIIKFLKKYNLLCF